jgi:membrane protease YdiL (CAAX protease family)
LIVYLVILAALCAGFVVGTRLLGKQGVYLAQAYMLTPALAAILTRALFYKPRFSDANLRLGRMRDYLKFWMAGIGITAISFVLFTVLGAVSWDFTGQVFLDQLARQFAESGQDMTASLPRGLTPYSMLLIFFAGGLTVFNVLPGIVMGFGEEFGARGLMFPLMYRVAPWVGFIIGGLTWYAWHLPLALVTPHAASEPAGQLAVNHLVLASGAVCTATYLAYVYVKSRSVWVTSVAHITLNNAARSLAYCVVVRNQLLANVGLAVTMLLVVVVLYLAKELEVFAAYFKAEGSLSDGAQATVVGP